MYVKLHIKMNVSIYFNITIFFISGCFGYGTFLHYLQNI